MNASVSHYGSNARLVETVGNSNTSQGCIYCHYDTGNAAAWGSAPDPRTSTVRPHGETQNSQCWGCHVQGGILPSTFHNETLFAGGGGTAPPVPSGSPKLLVATNRYVILDDGKTGKFGPGFGNPGSNSNGNFWTGKNTIIKVPSMMFQKLLQKQPPVIISKLQCCHSLFG